MGQVHYPITDNIEIMAPAGSFAAIHAALDAGAESVYFGIGQLNMRSKSALNFKTDDLDEIVKLCHSRQKRCYLALNTVIYDRELNEAVDLMKQARKAGVDAMILSDQALLEQAYDMGIEVHLSTQLNVSNYPTVRFYSRYADVLVLARELNLEQVAEISRQVRENKLTGPSGRMIRLEMFVHGALCMAVSGKCYLSLHQYNSSANRGACLQGCRRSYIVRDKETGDELEIDNEYIMSPKDLCTIGFLDKILDAGITILKIEGRARPPEYVHTVTSTYHDAVDTILAGQFTQAKIDRWMKQLSAVFNRGFWDGYYLGQRLGEWNNRYGSNATMRRVYLGKGVKYYSRLRVGEFVIETKTLNSGDEIIITGPTTGLIRMKVDELWLDDHPVSKVKKGDHFSFRIDQKIRPSDKLYKWVPAVEVTG